MREEPHPKLLLFRYFRLLSIPGPTGRLYQPNRRHFPRPDPKQPSFFSLICALRPEPVGINCLYLAHFIGR